MAHESFSASAPGSLMILGEHAVLRGYPAIVCAVNRRIEVRLTPRTDEVIHIDSPLGIYQGQVDDLSDDPRIRFVLSVLSRHRTGLPSGFHLAIRSGFSHEVGFGSSAAVTAAMNGVLRKWLGLSTERLDLFQECRSIIQEVQGVGSGADAAASVYGGMLLYGMTPLRIEPLNLTAPITVVYSGHKEPTVEVVRKVDEAQAACPDLFADLFALIGKSVEEAAPIIRNGNWPALGRIMNVNQGLMDALGVNAPRLAEIVLALRARPDMLGAKISGSGLGDCVVGLGRTDHAGLPGEVLPVEMTQEGLIVE